MMIDKFNLVKKHPLTSHDNIEVLTCGPKREGEASIYLFSDVLEELVFNAHQRSARGMLLGRIYAYPKLDKVSAGVDKKDLESKVWGESSEVKKGNLEKGQKKPQMYMEIAAFKDIYPTEDALDYGMYLRRHRDFRTDDGEILVLGSVCMTPKLHELTLEDLLFQRTYCAEAYQIALFVSADGRDARIFVLDEMLHAFVEVGYRLVCSKSDVETSI
jgi:hypothetical protein